MFCFWQKVEDVALVKLCLSDHTALKEGSSGAIEGSVKDGQEDGCVFRENLLGLVVQWAENVYIFQYGRRVDRTVLHPSCVCCHIVSNSLSCFFE